MPPRHLPRSPLPRCWLMTDERLGERLWDALARLPRGGGVVFRHYATPARERRALFAQVLRVARRRGLVVVRAGVRRLPGEMGVHNRREPRRGLRTRAVHDLREAATARRLGVNLVFVSPVFATRSHPEARELGPARAAALARAAGVPTVALGGVDARRFRRLRGFWGWAGVGAWVGETHPSSR